MAAPRPWRYDLAMEIIAGRFRLRDFDQSDRGAFLAYHAVPCFRALYGPQEADPGHAGGLLETFRLWASERPRRNYQLAIVQLQELQAMVGCCGLRGVVSEIGRAELGVELAPQYWGRYGYALEVTDALLKFGFGDLGLREIGGFTAGENTRVARLASCFGVAIASRAGPGWMRARGRRETEWRISRDCWKRSTGPDWRRGRSRERCRPLLPSGRDAPLGTA